MTRFGIFSVAPLGRLRARARFCSDRLDARRCRAATWRTREVFSSWPGGPLEAQVELLLLQLDDASSSWSSSSLAAVFDCRPLPP
jgi:hypothetical protein